MRARDSPVRFMLHGHEVRVLGKCPPYVLVERVDGVPLDDYGLRKRDWISSSAVTSETTTRACG